jgi:hypothetical protein
MMKRWIIIGVIGIGVLIAALAVRSIMARVTEQREHDRLQALIDKTLRDVENAGDILRTAEVLRNTTPEDLATPQLARASLRSNDPGGAIITVAWVDGAPTCNRIIIRAAGPATQTIIPIPPLYMQENRLEFRNDHISFRAVIWFNEGDRDWEELVSVIRQGNCVVQVTDAQGRTSNEIPLIIEGTEWERLGIPTTE